MHELGADAKVFTPRAFGCVRSLFFARDVEKLGERLKFFFFLRARERERFLQWVRRVYAYPGSSGDKRVIYCVSETAAGERGR